MNTSIADIMNAVATAKNQIRAVVAEAKAAAPKGEKMPHGQHAQFVASSQVAAATLKHVQAAGYVEASCRFTKTGDFVVTYRQPVTLADRLTKHAASVAKRKAAIEERKGKKAAPAEKGATVTRIDLSSIAVKKAA